jgi:hypothetical protein
MKAIRKVSIIVILVLGLSAPVLAGGSRFSARLSAPTPVAPRGTAHRPLAPRTYVIAPYSPFSSYPYGYYGYYHPPVVVSPYHYYPYYVPPPVVVNTAFFCVLHQVGFVSRVGMIDHLAGSHKFPMDTAASLCPDGTESCLFPSY